MKQCTQCGFQLQDFDNVCPQCGTVQPLQQAQAMPQYAPVMAPSAAKDPGKGLGIAGMVLGIVGLVLFCFVYVGLPCSIVGLILSAVGMKKSEAAGFGNGMGKAGLICSLIAVAIDVLLGIVFAGAIASLIPFSF